MPREEALTREVIMPVSAKVLAPTAYGGTALYLLSPDGPHFPAALASVLIFAVTPILLAKVRPSRQMTVSPLNVSLAAFFLQLVVVPLLICYFGPLQWVLPYLPTNTGINEALLVQTMGFVAFCLGYQWWSGRSGVISRGSRSEPNPRWSPSNQMLIAFTLVGLIGMLLTFHSVAGLRTYFTQPQSRSQFSYQSAAGWKGLAGILFRPFLGIAAVALWCRLVDRGRLRSITHRWGSVTLLILFVYGVYGTYNYNRGAFVVPLIAIGAVYTRQLRRVSPILLVPLVIVSLIGLTALRAYRNSDANNGIVQQVKQHTSVNVELQVYAAGPQFLAYLMLQQQREPLLWGTGVVSGVLSPVPVLGKSFRTNSDSSIYNEMIYGNNGDRDQVVPLQGELIMNWGLASIPVGFLVLGVLMAWMQDRFRRAKASLQIFVWQYTGAWTAFLIVGSLEVVSQILVYFFWPIYVLGLLEVLRRPRGRLSTPARLAEGRQAPIVGA